MFPLLTSREAISAFIISLAFVAGICSAAVQLVPAVM